MMPNQQHVKGTLDDVGGISTVKTSLSDLALNVGEHVEDHWKLFRILRRSKWLTSSSAAFAAGLGHEGPLVNTKLYATTAEYLVVIGRLFLQYDQ